MKRSNGIICRLMASSSLLFVLAACSITSQPTKPVSAENSQAAELNAKLSLAYMDLHDLARAKQKILLAEREAPHDPLIWYTQGFYQEQTGEMDQAEKSYLHAINLAPNNGGMHNNYGAFLCRQGRYRQAIQQFLIAVRDPSYLHVANTYENAGSCALKIPDMAMAKKFFQQAESEDPKLGQRKGEGSAQNYHDYCANPESCHINL